MFSYLVTLRKMKKDIKEINLEVLYDRVKELLEKNDGLYTDEVVNSPEFQILNPNYNDKKKQIEEWEKNPDRDKIII